MHEWHVYVEVGHESKQHTTKLVIPTVNDQPVAVYYRGLNPLLLCDES